MNNDTAEPLLAALQLHYDELHAFVRRKVRCPALAADILQDTYVRLASRGLSEAVRNPRALLYRVAGNLAIDQLRLQETRARYVTSMPLSENLPDSRPSAETEIDAKQRLALLMEAVDELPPRCRQVFVLRKFEDFDQSEIAATLGISRNMVEKHLRKALLHCAMKLKKRD